MNVFADLQEPLKPHPAESAGTRIAGTVLLLSLVLGGALVVWRTAADLRAAQATAAAEARACAAAIELELRQAATAVETLTSLARQAGGAPPNFPQNASALLSSRPGIAAIELQPGGIVRDIIPRAGNEKALGRNVLSDPVQRAAANEAVQRRSPAVLGPAMIYTVERGIVARAAVFQRGRTGQESFWGFVAASVRLADLENRAQLAGLWKKGYGYSLYVPATGSRSSSGLLLRGEVSLGHAIKHSLQVYNLPLTLAVEPAGGWINKPRAAVDAVLVLLISGLLWVGARFLESKRATNLELADLQQRAEHDSKLRLQAEEDTRRARQITAAQDGELKRARSALEQAEAARMESAARLESQSRLAEQARNEAQAKERAAVQAFSSLQDQLSAANRAGQEAAKAHGAAQEQTQAMLKQAQGQVAELQRRLEETARAHKEALAENLRLTAGGQETVSSLQQRMEAAENALRATEQALQARIADLQKRNQELSAQARKASNAEERIAELTARLQEARAQLHHRHRSTVEPSDPLATEVPTELKAETAKEPMQLSPVTTQPEATRSSRRKDAPQMPVEDFAPAEPEATAVETSTVPPTAGKESAAIPASRPGKRKKSRRDSQMDLFLAPAAQSEPSTETTMVAVDPEVADAWPIEPESRPSVVAGPVEEEAAPVAAESPGSTEAPAELEIPGEGKPASARRLPAPPPLDAAQLRKAMSLILPLLMDGDPGAKDCLKDNRNTFRSGFSPEGYADFEQMVRKREYAAALESLKKAAKKHGIPV